MKSNLVVLVAFAFAAAMRAWSADNCVYAIRG